MLQRWSAWALLQEDICPSARLRQHEHDMCCAVPNSCGSLKVSERVEEGKRVPDPSHDKRGGGVGGAEEGVGVADGGGTAAGNGSEDDQGKNQ